MKKLFTVVTVVTVLMSCTTSRVQSQPPFERNRGYNENQVQHSFDYYPSANVYYESSCNSYIYNNGRTWVTSPMLPQGIFLGRSKSYPVYCYGNEIWRDNDNHRRMYSSQPGYQNPNYDPRDQYGSNDRNGNNNWDRDRDRDRGRDRNRGWSRHRNRW